MDSTRAVAIVGMPGSGFEPAVHEARASGGVVQRLARTAVGPALLKAAVIGVVVTAALLLSPADARAQEAIIQRISPTATVDGWHSYTPTYRAVFTAAPSTNTTRALLVSYQCVSGSDVILAWDPGDGSFRTETTAVEFQVPGEGVRSLECAGWYQAQTRSCSSFWGCSAWSDVGDPYRRIASAIVRIDTTPPTAQGVVVGGGPAHNGWYNEPFTIMWTGHDEGSGIASCGPSPSLTGTTSHIGHTSSISQGIIFGGCRDRVGHQRVIFFSYKYDAIAPTLDPAVPSPLFVGATAQADPNATDDLGGSGVATASCDPLDTDTPGTKTVVCIATDNAGNQATATAEYEVVGAPDAPDDLTVEATGPDGATVVYDLPTITDLDVSCLPAPGATFALGATTVTCTSTDEAGNEASLSFIVTVVDTTPPTLANLPEDLTVEATGPDGATVAYDLPTATDAVDPDPHVSCDHASGATFDIGDTTVTCTATDQAGNEASASFTVTVTALGVVEQLDALAGFVQGKGAGNSLVASVGAAQRSLDRGDQRAACNQLRALVNEANAQSGKKHLTTGDAQKIIEDAERIRAALGC